KTEQLLTGKAWSEGTIALAEASLDTEFTPLTDMRATQHYRQLGTAHLLRKFFIETTQPEAATRVLEVED
ncbi:MAG TPA: hypothetical protein VFQ88_10070, partial [Nevskiaceae bacterium]|nr:hypothetical protein [Nevskiaceae bacterium]